MRGKAASSNILNLRNTAVLCLLLFAGASGCKKEPQQVSRKQETATNDKAPLEKREKANEEHVNQLVFDMHLTCAYDLDEEISRYFLRGQDIYCKHPTGYARPGQYPNFHSSKPLRGTICFARIPVVSPHRNFYHLVIDESAGTGTGYDLLYFDQNGDGDLADEKALRALKDPPKALLRQYSSAKLQVCFESFEMTFDFGSSGQHAVEMMTRLIAREHSSELTFFSTKVRRGQIEIGDAKYDVLLGHGDAIGKLFDQPDTVFRLIPKNDPQNPPRWSGATRLNSMHEIDGKLYQFTTTPLGDKLFAQPYEDAFGTFEVGPGGRDVQDVSIQGSFISENIAVAIGDGMEHGRPKPTRSCRLPEGDYVPMSVMLMLDHLQIGISKNDYTDGESFRRVSHDHVYGIMIREDKPYIFDLTNEPNVLFASPKKNKRIKPGDRLDVKAVLVDPQLDILINRIYDTSRKVKKEYTTPDGKKHSFEVSTLLDPKVVIMRANGEKVAEGVMPFG